MKKLLRRLIKFRKRNNGHYYSRDYYYEISLDKYYRVESYLQYLNNSTRKAISTDQAITFSSSESFILEPKKYLKRKYGRPNFSATHKFPFGIVEIYFYKIFLGTQKARLEMHFFENKLFFFNYTFGSLKSEEEKKQILNVLTKKYLLSGQLKPSNEYILDQLDNCILVEDSVTLTINYICGITSKVFMNMKEYADKLSKEQREFQEQKERELYDRL